MEAKINNNLSACRYVIRLTALAALIYLSMPAVYLFLPVDFPSVDASAASMQTGLVLMCLAQAWALSRLASRSSWSGWKLFFGILAVYAGVNVVLVHIESFVFLNFLTRHMTMPSLSRLVINGLLQSLLISTGAAFLYRNSRLRPDRAEEPVLSLSLNSTLSRLSLAAVSYAVIYYLFGMFVMVPLAGPAFQEFYGDLTPPAWLPLLQVGRGYIFAGLALLAVRMTCRHGSGLTVALLFALLMGSNLFAPNSLMPDSIRYPHLVEVTAENFVFGWLAALILTRRKRSRPALEEGLQGHLEKA